MFIASPNTYSTLLKARKTFVTCSLSWEVNVGGQFSAVYDRFIMDAPVVIITRYTSLSYNDVPDGVYMLLLLL